ncbi:MAG: SIR2 family protein [Candidatus Bathyarchaeota archaeon]|nr:SIR2 family protein [Candidatus Bathyarchaeota archaeon]
MELSEVIREMQKKPTSLFYGAGVCVSCGGPNGEQLLTALKKQYVESKAADFFSFMQDTIDFDNFNRNEIESKIKQSLSLISPLEMHKYLFSMPWRAVITTNYDNLPNLITKSLDARRLIVPVVNPEVDYPIDPSKPDVLYCFKLLGDINYTFAHGGWMVLSSNDLKIAFDRRSIFFKMFHSLSSSGSIIYLGYSFKDNLVFDLLQEMRFVLKAIPWKSYAIMPDKPDEPVLKKMEKLGITWVKGSVEDFVKTAVSIFGLVPVSAASIVNQFNVHNIPMQLDRATVDNTWRKFRIFDVTMLEPFSKDYKHFFEGHDQSFYPFVANWDFKRKIKRTDFSNNQLKEFDTETFNKRTQDGNSSHNIVVSLVGTAGSGKTVVANRIAFDWYRSGNPVIFIDPETQTLDKLALDGLLDEIWEKYRSEITKTKLPNPAPLRFLLVADDCGALLEQLIETSGHLKGVGKPVDILLVTRITDLSIAKIKRANVDLILSVDDTVRRDEWGDFINHFGDLDVLNRELLSLNLADKTINTSFFALIFTTVKGVQKSLEDIITDELLTLDEPSRVTYSIVSLLQSQILTPPVSLTLSASRQNKDWLDAELEKGRLGGVLQYRSGEYEIVTANRVVADIIARHTFKTSDQLYNTLRNIVKSVNLGNKLEMTLLHLLLTERLRGELGTHLKPQEKLELLKNAVSTVRSRPLLLHLAMLQVRSDKPELAAETLREAMSAHIPDFDEPEEHVIDVKGRLELKLGEVAIKDKDKSKAWDHFEKAQNYFYDAQISPSATPHPYQGLGKTYVNKAKIADDDETRWCYLLLAMQECVYTEKYLGVNRNFGLSSLKKEVLELLYSMKLDEEKISRIRAQVGKGAAFAFLAEEAIRLENYPKAIIYVAKGLKEDPSLLWLIRLNVYLIKKQNPEDNQKISIALQDYVRLADKRFDVPLSFELAMCTFKNSDYKTASALFKELEERTKDHPMRLTQSPENRWNERGELKEILGILIDPPTYGKYGKIECTSLHGYRGPLQVRRQDIEGTFHGGERVSFGIIFNMVGPQATRVRRYS